MRYFLFCLTALAQCVFAQTPALTVVDHWQPYVNLAQDRDTVASWSVYQARDYGRLSPARFLSIDPLSEKYPHWTPYHYAMDNSRRLIDPTGKWVASYDAKGNVVNVQAEKNDKLEGLYTQLGVSAEDFAKKYDINVKDMSKYEVVAGKTTFDVTDFVFAEGASTRFSTDPANMNCFSSSLVGTGAVNEEIQVHGGFQFTQQAQELFQFAPQSSPSTGTLVTWVDNNGVTNHSAIYVVKDQSGKEYFVGRPGPNSPVAMQTSDRTNQLYPNYQVNFLRRPN